MAVMKREIDPAAVLIGCRALRIEDRSAGHRSTVIF